MSSIADSPVSVRLICPRCRTQTCRKWNADKSPYGFGFCRRCVPQELVVRHVRPVPARVQARIHAQLKGRAWLDLSDIPAS